MAAAFFGEWGVRASRLKVCLHSSWRVCEHWVWSEGFLPANGQNLLCCSRSNHSVDLISFLKAIPDGRYRRGVRYPQWFLLLVAVLGILSAAENEWD